MAVVPVPVPVPTTKVGGDPLHWQGATQQAIAAGTATWNQPMAMNASGGNYPATTPAPSATASDGITSYPTTVTLNGAFTTLRVPVKVTVTSAPKPALPPNLTITVTLIYPPGKDEDDDEDDQD